MAPMNIVQAVLEQKENDKNSNVIAIQLPDTKDKPIFRLVYRRLIISRVNQSMHVPLINYVHATDVNEANDFGTEMATKICGYIFCPHETEEIITSN